MRPIAQVRLIIALAVIPALASVPVALGEELINRRQQARQAFLAAPHGLYLHYCAHCHGEDGTGGGRLWASELPATPTDLTALRVDKEYVVAVIRDGSAAHGKSNLCPPWGRTISSANVDRLAQYVVSLGSQSSSQRPAPLAPARQPLPWGLLAVVLGEAVLLGWVLRQQKKEVFNVLPQDPLVRG